MRNEQIAKLLAVMAKMMPGGERIDETSADYLISILEEYDSKKVLDSLQRCFKELKFFPTVSEIIDRIDDGRPGTEEAWALAPKDDLSAAYLNDEIIFAWKVANDLLLGGGNMVGARMAFKEIYEKKVKENRSKGIHPKWWLSRASGNGSELINEAAMRDAVELGRISTDKAILLLPNFTPSHSDQVGIENKTEVGSLVNKTMKAME